LTTPTSCLAHGVKPFFQNAPLTTRRVSGLMFGPLRENLCMPF
jgi:hypothetical protein